MDDSLVLVKQEGAVRMLKLNRPTALNAFTTEMLAALLKALNDAADNIQVRCVLITGAGRGFCAGQDLSDAAISPDFSPGAVPKDIGQLLRDYYVPLAKRIRSMPVPVVAAVNGVAAGAGANFALGCDLVLAAKSASFIQAFSKIGLIPDCGGTWLLTRLVGRAQALSLAMLGDKLPAEEAQRIGMIYRCVADEELATTALEVANKLAAMPTKTLVQTRIALDKAMGMSLDDALQAEVQMQRELGLAYDYREGCTAFLQKRSANYRDR